MFRTKQLLFIILAICPFSFTMEPETKSEGIKQESASQKIPGFRAWKLRAMNLATQPTKARSQTLPEPLNVKPEKTIQQSTSAPEQSHKEIPKTQQQLEQEAKAKQKLYEELIKEQNMYVQQSISTEQISWKPYSGPTWKQGKN